MVNDTSDSNRRTRRAHGPSAAPAVWHLEQQGGRNFTIGVYSGVGERLNTATGKWEQMTKGYFAEISERISSVKESAGSTLNRYDRNHEVLYATSDMAHTFAIRRVRAIVRDGGARQA